MKNTRVFPFLFCSLVASATYAVEKDGYHLFNPTPTAEMREFATDRPDKTESPYTVDAGHFQAETDLIKYETNRDLDGTKTSALAINHANLKVGLLNNVDFQTVIETYTINTTTPSGAAKEEQKGFGDITLRLKVNLLGNDGGPLALGLMPFVSLPTSNNRMGIPQSEGGLIFLLAGGLPNDFSIGTMLELDAVTNEASGQYATDIISTVTIGYPLFDGVGGYTELFTKAGSASSGLDVTFDFGVTYEFLPNWQLDLGSNIGLSEPATDLEVFLGLSIRL